MLTSKEDIENDINETLEQLMQNSAALKMAKANHHFAHEMEQLEKMQESLLARLMHRQSLLEMDMREKKIASIPKQAIEEKVVELGRFFRQKSANTDSDSKIEIFSRRPENFTMRTSCSVHRHEARKRGKICGIADEEKNGFMNQNLYKSRRPRSKS